MSQKDNDLQKIKNLIDIMKNNDLVEIEIAHGGEKILLKRAAPQPPAITALPLMAAQTQVLSAASASDAAAKPAVADTGHADIRSPLVGTFYATPSPDSPPFVEVGSKVDSQTVVCIIEAMKVMNEIKAETSGTIVQVLVSNGQAVEYGQALFKIKPD